MPRSVTPELKDCIEKLSAEGERTLSARELADIVGEVARTLTADFGPLSNPTPPLVDQAEDAAPARDSDAAMTTLNEIGTIDHEHGPLADIRRELDEIRTATQDAAAKYLSSAEAIEKIADRPDLDFDDQAIFSQVSTDIFEASSFQDITGQRLTRISEILRRVEYLLASTKAALGDETAVDDASALSEDVEQTEHRKVEYILHGPQDAGTANTQEEIDKILASFD